MQPIDFHIEKIQTYQIPEVAELLTDSFETNPAYSIIFNKTNDPRKGLLWLFKANMLLLNQKQKLTYIIKEKNSEEIIGTYSLIPLEGAKPSIFTYFRIGLARFIYEFGFGSLTKMISLDNYNRKILNDSIKTDRYYYLSMVVVKEEYRGSGIGSCMIRECLHRLSVINRDCNLLGLTTQLPENLAFYSKLGFEKIDEGEIVFKKYRYYNYTMRYIFEDE